MENNNLLHQSDEIIDNPSLKFCGNGGDYARIFFVNIILQIITLGIYTPWATAARRKYMYQETELAGSRFVFHGTGEEMFVGMLKAIAIFAVPSLLVAAIAYIAYYVENVIFIVLAYYIIPFLLVLLTPYALHGMMRYRTSRSSWRGIHFAYIGSLPVLFRIFVKGMLPTIITLGIYAPWLANDLRKYIIEHIRFGNVRFQYAGKGNELFVIHLKGIILTVLTLGIYSFWYQKNLYNYYINQTTAHQDGEIIKICSTIQGVDFFAFRLINFILLSVTFGIATPWVAVMTMEFFCKNILFNGRFNPETLIQNAENYRNATGDDLSGFLEIDGLDI